MKSKPTQWLVMIALAACVWGVATGAHLAQQNETNSSDYSTPDGAEDKVDAPSADHLVVGQSPGVASKKKPKTPKGDFWLLQIDKYGIWGPLALGLLLWILGLLVIVGQAWSAIRERSKIADENEKTKQLLLNLARELDETLSKNAS